MELPKHWLTTPILDAEYKRYKLLAFLKYVDDRYFEKRLFPYADQVRIHTEALFKLTAALENMSDSFPKELSGIDSSEITLCYKGLVKPGKEMVEIEKIIEDTLPLLRNNLNSAHELIAELKRHIELFTVGLTPMESQYGYLLLQQEPSTRVYEYRLHKVTHNDGPFGFSSISTRYIGTWKRSPSNNFEQIKLQLIKRHNAVANPATFGFVSSMSLPHIETYLPLAKQMTLEAILENTI